jgi:hypothetical protein
MAHIQSECSNEVLLTKRFIARMPPRSPAMGQCLQPLLQLFAGYLCEVRRWAYSAHGSMTARIGGRHEAPQARSFSRQSSQQRKSWQ